MRSLILLISLMPVLLFAKDKNDDDVNAIAGAGAAAEVEIDTELAADLDASLEANLESNADLTANPEANNEGVDIETTSTNNSRFYALSLQFPQASGCFKGVQAGGADDEEGMGFFGIHLLNTNCFLMQQAATERSIEINARLKCGSKKYRNAVAFDRPRDERQRACVNMLVQSGQALMQQETQALLSMLEDQTVAINTHTSIENEGTRRVIEECTDCYGTK